MRAPVYDKDGQEQGFVMCSIAWEKVGARRRTVIMWPCGSHARMNGSSLALSRYCSAARFRLWHFRCVEVELAFHHVLIVLYHVANAGRGRIRSVVR